MDDYVIPPIRDRESGRKVRHMHTMEWEQIYDCLVLDREDCTAWTALQRRVRIWLLADGFRAHDLDDAVAEVVAAVVMTFDRARGAESFRGFVLGHRFNVRRRVRSLVRAPLVDLSTADEAVVVDAPECPDPTDLDRLGEALFALPEREYQAISLHYFRDLCSEQVALHLGVTPVNARQIVWQAIRRMRRQFDLAAA